MKRDIIKYLDLQPTTVKVRYGKTMTTTYYCYSDGVKALVEYPTGAAPEWFYPRFTITDTAGFIFPEESLDLTTV